MESVVETEGGNKEKGTGPQRQIDSGCGHGLQCPGGDREHGMKHEARQKYCENAGADRCFLAEKPDTDIMKAPAQSRNQTKGKCAHVASRLARPVGWGFGPRHQNKPNSPEMRPTQNVQVVLAGMSNRGR